MVCLMSGLLPLIFALSHHASRLFYLTVPFFVPEIIMADTARTDQILTFIREMNRCWIEGWNEEKFRQYIHSDVVAIVPTAPLRLEGKEAYVAGWRGFAESAAIHEWKETSHKVQLYAGEKCAVVTYLFSVTFTTGGHQQMMKGRDMFFLVREGRQWLVTADQFSPEPVAGKA
jgi:ketosteroid isomerase-like protein